jgi:hypothetical protein
MSQKKVAERLDIEFRKCDEYQNPEVSGFEIWINDKYAGQVYTTEDGIKIDTPFSKTVVVVEGTVNEQEIQINRTISIEFPPPPYCDC